MTPDDLKRNLADIGAAQSNARRSTAEIRKAATERLSDVEARISEIRPKAAGDKALGDEYMALIKERGDLHITLGDHGQSV